MNKKSVIIAVISLIIVVLLVGLVYILTGQKDANNKLEEGYTYYYLEKDKVANFSNKLDDSSLYILLYKEEW